MDAELCRRAAELMGCNRSTSRFFLEAALLWCGENVPSFELYTHRDEWHAAGEWIDLHDYWYSADNPYDALGKLIVEYSEWRESQAAATPANT